MPKRKPRLTRLGLPEKSERVIFAVTPEDKRSIKEAARARGLTVSAYLVAIHRETKGGKS
jgi:hypothetical protein